MFIDHRIHSVKEFGRQILKRFCDMEIAFLILQAHGTKNVNYMEQVMRMINLYVVVEKLKSGRDKKGYCFMMIKLLRIPGYMSKYEAKKDKAFARRVNQIFVY